MSNSTVHCSRSYHKTPVDELDAFAEGVRQGIFENPTLFPTPPVPEPAMVVLISTYVTNRAAYKQGGSAQKGPFLASKTALIDALDLTATYVDDVADGDANVITEAGFVPTKAGASEGHTPAQPGIPEITRGAAGELMAECPKVDGALYYGCIAVPKPLPPDVGITGLGQIVMRDQEPESGGATEPTGEISFIHDLNKTRKKKFLGLTSGVTYHFYFYAGNATGVSQLSDGRSLLCG